MSRGFAAWPACSSFLEQLLGKVRSAKSWMLPPEICQKKEQALWLIFLPLVKKSEHKVEKDELEREVNYLCKQYL